jgi:hypothetical protein
VLLALDQESRPAPAAVPLARFGWLPLILAVAAGFLLAVIVFQPWNRQPVALQPRDTVPALPIATPVAHLVVATGDVEMRAPAAVDWQPFPAIKSFTCPSRSEVRTGDGVSCELKTTEGCVIRLNQGTEITLASPTDITIRRGQIWCSSPENVSLKIVAQEMPTAEQADPPPSWSFACPSSSCLLTAEQPGGLQVMTAAGETELHTPHGSERLGPGEQAQIVSGKIVKSRDPPDPLLAAGWMHSLLACKGSSDAELTGRVDALLAQIGRSKAAWLYEQEIRGLGECAVLPLVRYVQSSQSRGEPARRHTAMRLVCDLAPSGSVPDLVGLLADDDAETRVLAATALLRLTGLDQGCPPADWRQPPENCAPALLRWQMWLTNRSAPKTA